MMAAHKHINASVHDLPPSSYRISADHRLVTVVKSSTLQSYDFFGKIPTIDADKELSLAQR